VGSLDPDFRRLDSRGNPINDPWETPFETGGFDVDAVAWLSVPEPSVPLLSFLAMLIPGLKRRRAG
jgi:hypothetical protein